MGLTGGGRQRGGVLLQEMRVKEGRVGEETEKLMQRGWNLKEFTVWDSSLPEADEVTSWLQLRPMRVWGLQEVETLEQGLWEMQQGASQSSSEKPEESKHPPGSFQDHSWLPGWERWEGGLGMARVQTAGRDGYSTAFWPRGSTLWCPEPEDKNGGKLAFVSTELCHLLRWPAFWLLTWGFPAIFLLFSR